MQPAAYMQDRARYRDPSREKMMVSAQTVQVLAMNIALAHAALFDIERHNANLDSSWAAGHTPFTGMTHEEFGAMVGNNPKPTEVTPTLTAAWPLQAEWERMEAANTTFPDWFG